MRRFKYPINRKVCNKVDDNAFDVLTKNYRDVEGTIEDLAKDLKAGYATCGGLLKGQSRCDSNFKGTNFSVVEFDNTAIHKDADGNILAEDGTIWKRGCGKKQGKIYSPKFTLAQALEDPFVSQWAAMLYTSFSHTKEWDRYRILFLLPGQVDDPELARSATLFLMQRFGYSDPNCKDLCRVWYGNTKAEFPILRDVTLPDEIFNEIVIYHNDRLEEESKKVRVREAKTRLINQAADQDCIDVKALVKQALRYCPPREPGTGTYSQSLAILTAIKSIFGDEGMSIAEEWSPSQKGWNIAQKWRGLSSGYGPGVIFKYAKENGWSFPKHAANLNKAMSRIGRLGPINDVDKAVAVLDQPLDADTLPDSHSNEVDQIKKQLDKALNDQKEDAIAEWECADKAYLELLAKAKESPSEFRAELALAKAARASARIRLENFKSDRHQARLGQKTTTKDLTGFEADYAMVNQLFDGKLRFNTLKGQIELDGLILPLKNPRPEITDLTGFAAWKTSDPSIRSMVLQVAQRNSYCPIQDYLLKVEEVNKGVVQHDFLDNLATRLFGTDSEVQKYYWKLTLIGAVKRAFEPGCQHDYMTILYSRKQGKRKSTLIRNLFGSEFTGEGMLTMGDKDSDMILQSSWVHEIPECDQVFRSRDSSEMKAYITKRKDIFRAPYSPVVESHLRRTIILGTTNHGEFLTDSTGERRWAIIEVADSLKECAHQYALNNRDLIFAAAVDGYRQGISTYLSDEMAEIAAQESKEFEVKDAWVEIISSWLEPLHKDSLKMSTLMTEALKLDPSQQTLAAQQRAGSALRSIGWSKKSIKNKVTGRKEKLWVRDDFVE